MMVSVLPSQSNCRFYGDQSISTFGLKIAQNALVILECIANSIIVHIIDLKLNNASAPTPEKIAKLSYRKTAVKGGGKVDHVGGSAGLGMVPMEYVGTDGNGQYVYRCRREGCHLLDSKQGGIRHCDTVYAQDPLEDIRLFGLIRRQSQEWRDLYRLRWSIEQLFKTQKQSRRLERHCTRGMANIVLHSLMSTLSFLATVLVDVQAQRFDSMRWGVRKVA